MDCDGYRKKAAAGRRHYISEYVDANPLRPLADTVKETVAVLVVYENIVAFVAPRKQVVKSTFIFNAPWSALKQSSISPTAMSQTLFTIQALTLSSIRYSRQRRGPG